MMHNTAMAIRGNRSRAIARNIQMPSREAVRALSGTLVKLGVTTFAAVMVLLPQLKTHASVAIEFDTDILFAQVNDWINVFLPILGIGIAIAIALALITFVGGKIVGAFRGGF